MEAEPPADAFVDWLRAFVVYVAQKRGLANSLMLTVDKSSPLFAESHAKIQRTGNALLDRARAAGPIRPDVELGCRQAHERHRARRRAVTRGRCALRSPAPADGRRPARSDRRLTSEGRSAVVDSRETSRPGPKWTGHSASTAAPRAHPRGVATSRRSRRGRRRPAAAGLRRCPRSRSPRSRSRARPAPALLRSTGPGFPRRPRNPGPAR